MSLNSVTHGTNVLRGALKEKKHCDLALTTVTGKTVFCHKVVLYSVSTKVRSALDNHDTIKLLSEMSHIKVLKTL